MDVMLLIYKNDKNLVDLHSNMSNKVIDEASEYLTDTSESEIDLSEINSNIYLSAPSINKHIVKQKSCVNNLGGKPSQYRLKLLLFPIQLNNPKRQF